MTFEIATEETAVDSSESWRARWSAASQPWRTEPEISASRKRALRLRLDVARDRDVYPFKDIEPRLTRADIEWLLATLDGGGPVNPYDPADDARPGLDLRSADLRGIDLSSLPLAHMRGGLPGNEWRFATLEQLDDAAVRLDGARLERAHLEAAEMPGAHLEGATLDGAYLNAANLSQAALAGATLRRACLTGAFLGGAHLAHACLDDAQLDTAFLVGAQLENASLVRARLDGTLARLAHLEQADVSGTHLEGADLSEAFLVGAQLTGASLDARTILRRAVLVDEKHGAPALADILWGGANVAATDWSRVHRLGDERIARARNMPGGTRKPRRQRLDEFLAATRAYRQTAAVLAAAGLRKEARHCNYRALALQRSVWRRQWRLPTYALWWLFFVVTGYGYKPLRAIACYLLIVAGFAAAYIQVAHAALGNVLAWKDAAMLSVGAFHGTALFAMAHHPAGPLTNLVIVEAVLGLLIELTVIASFAHHTA